jgi:V/A-type H+-transporting ATPase subunit C
MQQSYAGAFGRLKAMSLDFLTKDQLYELVRARDVAEIAQRLEATWYKDDIEEAAAAHKPPELIEIAMNHHLVNLNGIALQVSPSSGRRILATYLAKWDIENIELILAAKSLGRSLDQTEAFLVSRRNMPGGESNGDIPLSELRVLLEQPDVEGVINSLVKYGYGAVLLQQLSEFRKSGDLGVFSGALQNLYYSKLLWALRFVHGDEGVLREYIRAEIAKRNLLNLLKSKQSNLDREIVSRHLIDGGLISQASFLEAYNSPDIADAVKKLDPWFDLSEAFEKYRQSQNLTEFEVAIDKLIVTRYLTDLKSMALSLTAVFAFIFQAEIERQNIRRITYAKQYGMTEEYIKSVLLAG